jgi:hypothetical protein
MSEDEAAETQLDAELFISPLKTVASEVHEIYLELEAAGFPEPMLAQILAHMLSDALLYREEYMGEDADDEDDDEGDVLNERDE